LHQTSWELTEPILVCSVPKCGTHLLRGILEQVLGRNLIARPGRILSETDIRSGMILENKVLFCHLQHSKELSDYISLIPKILLVRDPRDYVVSQAYFYDGLKKDESLLEKRFKELPDWNTKISAAILGMEEGEFRLASVAEAFINYYINWLDSDNYVAVRFEDILLPKSVEFKRKGNFRYNIGDIETILGFLDFPINSAEKLIDDIKAGSDPARSATFRSGKRGTWRVEFNEDHVEQLKLVAPGLVTELGYERDEKWNLKDSSDSNICRMAPLHKFQSKALDDNNDVSSIIARYSKLTRIISCGSQSDLLVLLNSWAFRLLINAKAYREALKMTDALLRQDTDNAHWNYYQAFCLQQIGKDPRQAIKHYSIALDRGFSEFYIRYNRGSLLSRIGELEEANKDILIALELRPDHRGAKGVLERINAKRVH
jgi:tetratricopeptide (TPR) repeat protein